MTSPAASLQQNPPWETALAVRTSLAAHLHESWVAEMAPPASWAALLERPGSLARLSEAVRRRFAVEEVTAEACSGAGSDTALLPGPALADRLFLAGLVVNAPLVTAEIRRDRQAALRGALGEPGYRFAVHRAPFLADPAWFMPPHRHLDPIDATLPVRVLADGMACLRAALADGGRTLAAATLLKLPRGVDAASRALGLPAERAASILRKLHREEGGGAWASCS